ncbi:MAG: phage holin family protein [Lachnospiraceae bacterium]|nr:phage holin family protein [Lachnospiraceae bacterium]
MDKINLIKANTFGVVGVVGGAFAKLFGGWTTDMQTLIIFMIIDYITGFAVAAIFKKSQKTETGALQSNVGFKGLCKKCVELLFVLIAYRLDLTLGINYIKTAVVIAFIANESVSIIENAGLMGLPLPAVVTKAIDILKQKSDVEVK